MLQKVQDKTLFIVDFDIMPELPVYGDMPGTQLYADALSMAIREQIITEPGKYGIEIDAESDPYGFNVYKIME